MISERGAKPRSFSALGFEASLVEICARPKVLDLVGTTAESSAAFAADERSSGASCVRRRAVRKGLRALRDGTVAVTVVLKLTPVNSASCVERLMATARRRHTHATLMNAGSSRSHLVLTLYTSCKSLTDGSERGKLHLVDLAGSERVGKSGVVGASSRRLSTSTRASHRSSR